MRVSSSHESPAQKSRSGSQCTRSRNRLQALAPGPRGGGDFAPCGGRGPGAPSLLGPGERRRPPVRGRQRPTPRRHGMLHNVRRSPSSLP
ncbi:hypothetical protein GHT09_001956 [Marmota monax]|uniref:Uncharacterized protein n=1 Tax=Marmota monax TaxID=9995 RepID=A0A834PX07_MARMO|nr:hypothetical protein GHT09_001956 [Marmota monax]